MFSLLCPWRGQGKAGFALLGKALPHRVFLQEGVKSESEVSSEKSHEVVGWQFSVDPLRNKGWCQDLPQIYFDQKLTRTPGSQASTGLRGLYGEAGEG